MAIYILHQAFLCRVGAGNAMYFALRTSQFIIINFDKYKRKCSNDVSCINYYYYYDCCILMHDNNNELWSGFPPTSGQIPPTSGSSYRPNLDPHMRYTRNIP